MAAELVDVDARRVGRVRDVDDDREVGLAARTRSSPRRRTSSPPGPRPPRRRRPARRRRPRRAAPPRRRRSSPGGCPSSATRRGRWASRPARAAITATSPTRTSPRASSPSFAPMSMCRSLSSATFLRSSSLSRWIGFLPMTPGTTPSRVATSTRWPTRICVSHPPTPAEAQEPVVVDVGDDQPDLVDVPDDRERRAAARPLDPRPSRSP